MIVSHRHRFIFLKTRKTAGTSVETWLSQHCGEEDIVTPFGVEEPGHRPRNAEGCYNHMPAAEIRARVGARAWGGYYKFCFERNPWDKVASQYYFTKARHGLEGMSFERFVREGELPVDSPAYRLEGEVAMDRVGQYATLLADLAEICAVIGIAPPAALPRAKGGYRDAAGYAGLYGEAERRAVDEAFAWEIERFGYRF
jgi:hypothetical protein